jgi:hypothetical protein
MRQDGQWFVPAIGEPAALIGPSEESGNSARLFLLRAFCFEHPEACSMASRSHGLLRHKASVYGLSPGAILNAAVATHSQFPAHGRQLTYAKSALCIACRYRCNVPSCCDCVYLQTMQRLSQALEGSPSVPHITRVRFDNRSAWKTSGDGRFANAPIRFSPKDHSEGSVSQLGRTISPLRKADCDRSCAA